MTVSKLAAYDSISGLRPKNRHPGEGANSATGTVPSNFSSGPTTYFLAGALISGGFCSVPGKVFGAAGFSASGSDFASCTGCPLK